MQEFSSMYKNQLQELAQRSCFNLPSYSSLREGPDHAPRFKATVNFNGETFDSPTFCSTLRQAEHAAAEVALNNLANRGPSRALAARVLDETGVYKNLLQETAHRAGLNLPVYTTVRSGPGHVPVFSCTVELAGLSFSGESAKTKKQAQKNAALAAWSALKQLAQRGSSSSTSPPSPLQSEGNEEQEQVVIARILSSLPPAESTRSRQNDCKDGPQRSTSNSIRQTPPASSLYSVQYETWAYSGFPMDMAMYQMWQQAHLLQLQGRVLSLPVPPPPLPALQLPPFMQSVLQPDHLYFMTREQPRIHVGPGVTFAASSPSFHLSNHSNPTSTRVRSMVTIQEIQEEKTEGSSKLCPSEVIEPCVLDGLKKEDDKQKISETDGNAGESGHYPTRQSTSSPDHRTCLDSGFQANEYKSHNTCKFEYSQPNLGSHHFPRAGFLEASEPHLSAAAPVRIRTTSSSLMGPRPQNLAKQTATQRKSRPPVRLPCSTRPRREFGATPRFIAPPVQIRTVVPVCSAPPAIKSSGQEGQSLDSEKKSEKVHLQEGLFAVGPKLDKIRL